VIGARRDYLAPNLRGIPHGRYMVYYLFKVGAIFIVRVVHGARDARVIFGQTS
jgi:plasmid stabilization system protein ParE